MLDLIPKSGNSLLRHIGGVTLFHLTLYDISALAPVVTLQLVSALVVDLVSYSRFLGPPLYSVVHYGSCSCWLVVVGILLPSASRSFC